MQCPIVFLKALNTLTRPNFQHKNQGLDQNGHIQVYWQHKRFQISFHKPVSVKPCCTSAPRRFRAALSDTQTVEAGTVGYHHSKTIIVKLELFPCPKKKGKEESACVSDGSVRGNFLMCCNRWGVDDKEEVGESGKQLNLSALSSSSPHLLQFFLLLFLLFLGAAQHSLGPASPNTVLSTGNFTVLNSRSPW